MKADLGIENPFRRKAQRIKKGSPIFQANLKPQSLQKDNDYPPWNKLTLSEMSVILMFNPLPFCNSGY
jgi:hypothetical protein